MQSIDLIRKNLENSAQRTLLRIDEMVSHALVPPTPNGGGHTLWTLGHLAFIEALVTRQFMLGEPNPLSHWEETFDGAEVSADAADFPSFEQALDACRDMRRATLELLDGFAEGDLDRLSPGCPKGHEETFGTYRLCLQFTADHWYMHRGQLADARRAAGLERRCAAAARQTPGSPGIAAKC